MSTSSSDFSLPASTTSSTNTSSGVGSGTTSVDSSANSSAPSSADSSATSSPKFSSTPTSMVFASGSSSPSSLSPSDPSISVSSLSSSPSLAPQTGNKTHPAVPMNRKSSLIHRFKKTFWQGERTINSEDPKFDVAINQFKSLNDTFYRLRLHLNQYVGNLRGLITTSNAIALDFALGIDEQQGKQAQIDQEQQQQQSESAPNQSHDYSSILSAVRSSHQAFHVDRSEQLCVLLEREAIAPVDNALSQMIPINRDIEKRQQLRSEHDYYFKKLSTLQQERVMKHDGSSQDKQVDKKKEARLERNQAKYEEVNQEYHLFSSNLIQRLCSFYNHRVSVLAPSLQTFLKVEKEISEMLHQNKMSEQNLKEIEEKNAAKQEEMKEEEKKANQIIRKQTFAEHYFSSQEFFDDLQQAIDRRNGKNPMESIQNIEQKLEQSTQNLVQEAAKEKPDLTSTVLTERQPATESKETNREVSAEWKDQSKEVSTQPGPTVTEDVLNLPPDMKKTMKEESVQPNQKKEESETLIRITPNQSTSNNSLTTASDSFSKDSEPKSESKPLSVNDKEKTEFAGETRSVLTAPPKESIQSSEPMPERSPSVNEPTFHESDEQFFSKGGNQIDRDQDIGKEAKQKLNRSEQRV